MSHPLFGGQYLFDETSGRFINQKHRRVAEVVNEYDPELELAWIPPESRDEGDVFPYVVIHNHPNGDRQAVAYFTEDEIDERVIEHLFENDFRKHNPQDLFDKMEAHNLAVKLLEQKTIQEKYDAELDVVVSALKSGKHWYKHGGRKIVM